MTPVTLQILFWLVVLVVTIIVVIPSSVLLNILRNRIGISVDTGNLASNLAAHLFLGLHNVVFAVLPGVGVYAVLNGVLGLSEAWAALDALIIVTAAGFLLVRWLERRKGPGEYRLVSVLKPSAWIALFIVPLVAWPIAGSQYRQAAYERLVVKQLFHGSVISAEVQRITTAFDGQDFEAYYDCDPYDCDCTDEGCSTCYHRCPYTRYEEQYLMTAYWGQKSDGTLRLESLNLYGNQLPENPEGVRWQTSDPRLDVAGRNGEYTQQIPERVLNTVGVGVPAGWAVYRQALDAGVYLPISHESAFENPLMASDSALWVTHSAAVKGYLERALLPTFRRDPLDGRVDLLYTAQLDFPAGKREALVERLEEFNAAFGTERQGDLRLVFVGDPTARQEADAYITALKAYWSNPETQGDYLLAKNNLTLVCFTSDPATTGTVKAFTGMPTGNEGLLQAVNTAGALDNLSTEPDALLGKVKPELMGTKGEATGMGYDWEGGALYRLLWGRDDPQLAFVRVSMSENYWNFWKEVKPTPAGLVAPGVLAAALSGLIALGVCFWIVPLWMIYRGSGHLPEEPPAKARYPKEKRPKGARKPPAGGAGEDEKRSPPQKEFWPPLRKKP